MNLNEFKSGKFITSSMLSFMNEHIQSDVQFSILDDIILNYVATVLESLAMEPGSLEDSFDVEEFCEIVGAYCPQFTTIAHPIISQWVFDLVTALRKSAKEVKPQREPVLFESLLNEIEMDQEMIRAKRNSESSSDSNSSYYGSSKKGSNSRSPRVSETSDIESENDVNDVIQSLQFCQVNLDEKVETLREMFPDLTKGDANHVISVTGGDLEKAVQMILLETETGNGVAGSLRLNGGPPGPCVNFNRTKSRNIGIGGRPQNEEKVLKDRIVARYGFIDQAEDKKEFRPPPMKTEPKKLVRYRESQVVSTKGERYSEVRCKDGGEVKNYINKSHKQHN